MKKLLLVLILGALPGLALASENHAGGHDMTQMSGKKGMSRGEGEGAMGRAGDPARVKRTIEVTMDDAMRFTPGEIKVKAGETVRFLVRNTGKTQHEMVIGSISELKEHAEMMRKMPGMQHAEPNKISLKPGQRGGIVWQFDKAGVVNFACLEPGHMEAGMVGKIKVE